MDGWIYFSLTLRRKNIWLLFQKQSLHPWSFDNSHWGFLQEAHMASLKRQRELFIIKITGMEMYDLEEPDDDTEEPYDSIKSQRNSQ